MRLNYTPGQPVRVDGRPGYVHSVTPLLGVPEVWTEPEGKGERLCPPYLDGMVIEKA